MIVKAVIITLALGIVANAALDRGVHSVAQHERSTPVPSCLVTGLGAKLCDADARAWCESISEEVGVAGTPNRPRNVPADAQDACESVGWTR